MIPFGKKILPVDIDESRFGLIFQFSRVANKTLTSGFMVVSWVPRDDPLRTRSETKMLRTSLDLVFVRVFVCVCVCVWLSPWRTSGLTPAPIRILVEWLIGCEEKKRQTH